MNTFAYLRAMLVLCLAISAISAQEPDNVRVSPKLVAELQNYECTTLNLGETAISTTPKYPREAKSARIGGMVKVKVQVDKDGNVAEILDVNGHKLLKASAARAAGKIKFSPTTCDGVAKPVTGYVTYNYSPYVYTESYFTPNTIEEFTDIDQASPFYESVLYLTENYRLAFGFRDKKFHPRAPITKGEFAHYLRITLDMLSRRAKLASKDPLALGLYRSHNPHTIRSLEEITDVGPSAPYSGSMDILLTKYNIALVNEAKKFSGKLPLTNNEIIDLWTNVFGADAVPVNFNKIENGDRIFSRGEFALFLQESLYVLTYKVIP